MNSHARSSLSRKGADEWPDDGHMCKRWKVKFPLKFLRSSAIIPLFFVAFFTHGLKNVFKDVTKIYDTFR
jgi:hypothetical protein